MSSEKLTKNKNKWNEAMLDAKREVAAAKHRIKSLEKAIQIMRRKIAEGEPWPTDATQSPSA